MMNPIIAKLPRHLLDFMVEQHYQDYTPVDHAVWRYVMRQNLHHLSAIAHESYVQGLKKTGISIDKIPDTEEMNEKLGRLGWAAVAVDGFIPPSAFMEFQAYNVLVIAADIRPVTQIGYTPAPDILHEAAGHAPIIADPAYANYLKKFGEIGSKAFQSRQDYKLYEAIRHLSILKADPHSTEEEITNALHELIETEKSMGPLSEMAMIRNLHWWTVEYGLIGDVLAPKIYGAGLLSSISESMNCLKPEVRKIPYSLEASRYAFDITEEQPQLFVTPDFEFLNQVLEEFADTMALRKGGEEALRKAKDSGSLSTITLRSGLQISGVLNEYKTIGDKPFFIRFAGPVALAFENQQIDGHGKEYHFHGFSSPIGNWSLFNKSPEELTLLELEEKGIVLNHPCRLRFTSGVELTGILRNMIRKADKNLVFSFSDAIVSYQDEILFHPDWGTFDLAIGSAVQSAFNGPADADAYELRYDPPTEKTHKILLSESSKKLHALYQTIRDVRDGKRDSKDLKAVWSQLQDFYPEDWLSRLEILEIITQEADPSAIPVDIRESLQKISEQRPDFQRLIQSGLELIFG